MYVCVCFMIIGAIWYIVCIRKKQQKTCGIYALVLFVSGAEDPCMINVRHFAKAVQNMRHAGYLDVKGKLYPGMRHEILNEKNKEQVYHDIAVYLKKKGY